MATVCEMVQKHLEIRVNYTLKNTSFQKVRLDPLGMIWYDILVYHYGIMIYGNSGYGYISLGKL